RPPKTTLFPYTTLFRSHKTYQDVITPANYNAFLARLDHIKLSNFDNTVISAFDFVYDDISKTRKLITKIEKTNSNYEYAFEYLGDRKSTRLNSSHVKIS